MSRKHANHNWSSAKTWLACDLHVPLKIEAHEKGLEWDKPSAASKRGTKMHDAAELAVTELVKNGRTTGWTLPEIEGAVEVGCDKHGVSDADGQEVVEAVTEVCLLLERITAKDGVPQVLLEPAVALPHEPESNGYIDVLIVGCDDVWIVDYKFGANPVSPRKNPQLMGYYCSVLDYLVTEQGYDLDDVPNRGHLGIMQPSQLDEILWWDTSIAEAQSFMALVFDATDRQLSGVNLRPAAEPSVCQYCPAARLKRCSAHTKMLTGMAELLLEPGEHGHDPKQVEWLVRNEKALVSHLKDLRQEIIEDEETYPDWRRAQVKNPLKWNPAVEEEVLMTTFSEAGVDPFVVGTPAAVRKANPGHEDLIKSLCNEQGYHTRLTYKPKEN